MLRPVLLLHLFMLGPVLLLHAPLHAPSCSVPSTSPCSVLFSCYICSCSVLFSCYMHPFMLHPVLFLPRLHAPSCSPVTSVHARSCSPVNAPLHAQSCSPVPSKSSCSVLFSCYMHLFLLDPVLLLDAPFIPSTTAVSHCTCHSIHTTSYIYVDWSASISEL
jgi:hypothetical protein